MFGVTGAQVRTYAVLAILAFIGAVVLHEYASRVTQYGSTVAALWAVGMIGAYLSAEYACRTSVRARKRTQYYGIVAVVIAVQIGIVLLTPDESRVGRLIAIRQWTANFVSGHFPYDAPVRPSSFPMLFLVALPFSLTGMEGLLQPLGLAIAAIAIRRFMLPSHRMPVLIVLLLMPTLWYEVVVRSELFFNMALVLGAFLLADKYVRPGNRSAAFFLTAVVFGLVLSTRSVVAIPYAVWWAWRFRGDVRTGLLFAGVVAVTFAATLVPFALWHPAFFSSFGPFATQTRFTSLPFAVIAGAAAVWLGWRSRGIGDVFLVTGAVLFVLTLLAFIDSGRALTTVQFDLGYFVLPVPFLAFSLAGSQRFVGR